MARALRHLQVGTAVASLAVLCLFLTAGSASAAAPGVFGVDFTSATQGWAVGSDCTIARTTNGGLTWQTQFTRPGGPALLGVCVLPDGKTGWAVGAAGTVLRTNDGVTWKPVTSSVLDATVSYTSVKFVDAKTGWICGGVAAGPFQGLPRGGVWRSTDGGATWSGPAATFPGWCPLALDAVSASRAVCAGVLRVGVGVTGCNTPALVQTTNGTSWGSSPVVLRAGFAQTAEIGDVALTGAAGAPGIVAVGDYSELLPPTPIVFAAQSGAASLSCAAAPKTGPSQLRGVSMPTATVGYAVGSGAGALLKTTTGGATWTVLPTSLGKNLYAVDFVDAATGYAAGRNAAGTAAAVIKTTNGGVSWSAVR